MRVKAHLSDYEKRNGTRAIRLYYTKDGQENRITTKISIKPDQWNGKSEKIIRHPLADQLNKQLQHQIKSLYNDTHDTKHQNPDFLEYLNNFVKKSDKKEITKKAYRNCLTRLEEYCKIREIKRLRFSDMNQWWYYDFLSFITEQKGFSSAGTNHIKCIKAVLRRAHQNGDTNIQEYTKPYFKKPKAKVEPKIYLTEEEIGRIMDLPPNKLTITQTEIRDFFFVQYSLVLRYSDLFSSEKSNFVPQGGRYFYSGTNRKTKKRVSVPVSSKALSILKKYHLSIPGHKNQTMNRELKKIAQLAEIDAIENDKPKYSQVSTHTARRSAATNLYLSGDFQLKQIAEFGGWSTEKESSKYLGIDLIETGRVASKSKFFQ